ncbi:MAG TPA: 5'-nucleotidase C-terminal domain-containing protein, partial [Anaerolineales bacterium]|nr:5'-nucleotidase C-terminal domain-containing protein [Anaerolineales bacterium]
GVRAKAGGGYEVVSRAGQYLSVGSSVEEKGTIKGILDPYIALFNNYNTGDVGETLAPIDALQAYTQETSGANIQADAAVYVLRESGIDVDFHLSGAMSNRKVAASAAPGSPVMLKVSDMFSLMPYENSLVVMEMNGPQLKAVLERAYRNYYYYKYVPGYGGYSYYTTCMIDINSLGKITYNDLYPAAYDPAKSYVVSLEVDGHEIDFTDAATYYKVSTVNYLAAGSCNFNNGGVSLWPLNQIVSDTQYYVRDAVIDYIKAKKPVSPAVEGRLNFISDTNAPLITINAPAASDYLHPASLTIDFTVTDDVSGVKTVGALLDGTAVDNGQVIDLYSLALGPHTFTVNAEDKVGNTSSQSVEFKVTATIESLMSAVQIFYHDGSIHSKGVYRNLMAGLKAAAQSPKPEGVSSILNTFIQYVRSQRGWQIKKSAADLLIADTKWVIVHLEDTTPPVIRIESPRRATYSRFQKIWIDFEVFDSITGVKEINADLDGVAVADHQKLDLRTLAIGEHTLTVTAVDYAGNESTKSVKFKVR